MAWSAGRSRRVVAAMVALLLAAWLVWPPGGDRPLAPVPGQVAPRALASPLPSDPVNYSYDAAGQLTGVAADDAAGSAARYHYDDAGNLTSIESFPAATVSIASLVPARGAPGSSVTVAGTGFSATASQDTVSFHGTQATVTAASATSLTVTVPAGASSGGVTVVAPGGSATSDSTFTVESAAGAPSISGVSPSIGTAGTAVTVSGSGFDTHAAGDTVLFGKTRATVTAASATSLTVTVPEAATSGPVRVLTDAGQAASGSDFVVVPDGYAVSEVADTASLTVDGAATTVTIDTAGQVALLWFAGTKGQRLSLGLTNASISTDFGVAPFTPYGSSFGRDLYDQPRTSSRLQGADALPVLPTTGVYQVVIDPAGDGTGSVTATLSSRVSGSLSTSDAGTSVSLDRAGQQAELSFSATAGQPVDLGFTNSSFADDTATVQILEPHGTPVLWDNSYTGGLLYWASGDFDFTPAETGTYTILFGATDQSTGSVTVVLSHPVDAGTLAAGSPVSASLERPGQDALLHFAGTAGQAVSLDFTAYSFDYLPYVTVTGPDGTAVFADNVSDFHIPLPALPSTGTYTVEVSPYSSTGSFRLQLTQVTDAGSLTATGPAATVSLTTAGQTASLAFAATSGQPVTVAFTDWTLPSSATLTALVTDAAGTVVARWSGVFPLDVLSLTPASTGTYHLLLYADDATSTGQVDVTLSNRLNGGSLAVGATTTITASRVGQATAVSVAATAGEQLSLLLANYTFQYWAYVRVYAPDGTLIHNATLDSAELDLDAVPSTGTYTIVVAPYAETGSTDVTLVQRVDTGTTTVGGATHTLTVSQAGRYAQTSFTATAGQRLSFGFTDWTFTTSTLYARLLDPAGQVVAWNGIGQGGSMDAVATTAGTYRLIVGADDLSTGSVTLTASNQKNAGSITRGTAKTVTISRAGQSAYMTYAGTAGQALKLAFTNVTMPYYPYVQVTKPDGTLLTSSAGAASITLPALPSTGSYEILINPYSYTGAATLTLTNSSTAASPAASAESFSAARNSPLYPVASRVPHHARHGTHRLPRHLPRGHRPAFQHAAKTTAATRWTPGPAARTGTDWNSHLPTPDGVLDGAPKAGKGVTALAGRVLAYNGTGLAGVTVSIDNTTVHTNRRGWFLLTGVGTGHRVLRVDGSSADTTGKTYGLFDIGVDVAAHTTTVMSYPVWLSTLDTKDEVSFSSPTTSQVTLTTPAIPGLQVTLPAGSTVRDVDGNTVTKLGITAIPLDRAPYPLVSSIVPVYFTVQPGSSYVFPDGARVIYPNYTHAAPGTVFDFWNYDPTGRGWYIYGKGAVSADGQHVVPDPGVKVYQFTGSMFTEPGVDPPSNNPPPPGDGSTGGDPVDLATGQMTANWTDLSVSDTLPISVNRSYVQSDTGHRAFGIGANLDYDMYLYSENEWVDGWLILPNDARVHFHRITPGGTGAYDFYDAVFAADPTPTAYNGSTLAWNGDGWDLHLRDGTTLVFGNEAPLRAIRDRYGNTITITRAPAAADSDGNVRLKGPITQVTSPNGRWIHFGYDSSNRITSATDNLGRTVTYTYNSAGYLSTVTDPDSGVTTYTYDTSGRMATITDPRNTTYLTNTYNADGRVSQQTLANGGTYQFTYTTDASGAVTGTDVTDPNGHVRRLAFNSAGYAISDTAAAGTSNAQTTTITRDATSNLVTATVDALGRRTAYTYDDYGDLTSVTQLAGTDQARTETLTYGPYDQPTSVTDWLGHTTTYTYTDSGALASTTDPAGRTTTLETNTAGQVTALTDNLGNTTQYSYTLGDLTSLTDPLGRTSTATYDATGRQTTATDPTGSTTSLSWTNRDQLASTTDPLGRSTSYIYDPNGNLASVTDPRGHTTSYGYDQMDQLSTVTDPLGRDTSYAYDTGGNLTQTTSAAGQVTTYAYDPLNRLTTASYGVSGTSHDSQVSYSYDPGNRLTTVDDSIAGATSFSYDDLDNLTTTSSPQGQIDYTYDTAGRRTSMTVAGQDPVTYTYNTADQLTSAAQGSLSVSVGYDGDGRPATVTLADSITQTYAYDTAGQTTAIDYTTGGTSLGDLTYTYDPAGRPTHEGGAFARATIPTAYGPVIYDAANQISSVGTTNYTYNANGDLTTDGATTYTWNPRNQLTTTSTAGTTTSYGYDGLGRRVSRTTGSTTTEYLYDGLNTVQELTDGTATANLLTGGTDQVFARTTSTGTQSLLTDALGSTTALADTSGALTAEYTYTPYGATTLTGDDTANPTRFAGREDQGNGLYYNRARYYTTANARFTAPDPLGPIASPVANTYSYVVNQPTDAVDPRGLQPNPPRMRNGYPDEEPEEGDTTDLYRVSPNARGSEELENGLNLENFPETDELDGSAHFGNEARVNDWIAHHSSDYGQGFKVTVPNGWLADNNIEIWEGLTEEQLEYVIPRELFNEFNQFPRTPWTPAGR